MADAPPVSGELVSMTREEVAVALAARVTEIGVKWQVMPAGSDPQPSPMVSVKPLCDVSVNATVAFSPVAMVTLAGLTAIVKPLAVPETDTGAEVDALCVASPL